MRSGKGECVRSFSEAHYPITLRRSTLGIHGGHMNQRRRLTFQEREEAGAATRAQHPGKLVFVQEWTDADGTPVIVTIRQP
jgi:hypothetical protein